MIYRSYTRPLHYFSSCWLSLTNRRFKSRWVELMCFKPELDACDDRTRDVHSHWHQLEMLGKVLEMESIERSEAHSFDPQRLFAHILSSWFETLAMFHMGIHYCTVYMTGKREKHKCSPPTTVFLFKSCNLWNLVSAVGRLWFYAACWQEALCRVSSSTCGKESVGKERHTDWSGLWITAAEKVKVFPSPLFWPLQVSVSAVYRLSRVTVTTVGAPAHWPPSLSASERWAKLASPAPSLSKDPESEPEPDRRHTHEEQYVSEGEYNQPETRSAPPDCRDAETITGAEELRSCKSPNIATKFWVCNSASGDSVEITILINLFLIVLLIKYCFFFFFLKKAILYVQFQT